MIRPTGKYVLVKPTEPKTQTDGGIVLPEAEKKTYQEGVVEASARGLGSVCQRGQVVIFPLYEGVQVDDMILVAHDKIIGIRS